MTSQVQPPMEPTVGASGIPHTDGRISFKGYSTWYRIYGGPEERGKLPLL